ncbi:MAG: hypothetical protein R3F13_03080 [Prosthecobacter sp.]
MIPRIALLIVVFLSACQSRTEDVPDVSAARDLKEEERLHKAGLVLLHDLRHASAWEKLIHSDMGVPSRKIEVQAGPGITTLLIKELANRADAESVAKELRDIAAKQPETFGPTKVEIRLQNGGPPTISPFVLPTEGSVAPVNPGSALPTLSLPPLQPVVR